MKHHYSSLQDFLQDDDFVRWVLTGENSLYWEDYRKKNPEAALFFNQARELIFKIRENQEQQQDINGSALWNRIKETMRMPEEVPSEIKRKTPIWFWAPAAAMLILLVGVVVWVGQREKSYRTYKELITLSENPEKRIEKQNHNASPLLIELEDGSTILLRKDGKVSYPDHFNNQLREVILSGEAFFKIAENPEKPFYVYTNGCVTKVLGTSFDVKSDEERKQVTVDVRSGSVSVFSASISEDDAHSNKSVVLTANQRVIFDMKEEILTRSLVHEPQKINSSVTKENLYFEEAPITEILKIIELQYGIDLLYDEKRLSNCFITTTLTNDPLYEQLSIICKTIGATYHEADARIMIESAGCN